MYFGGLYSIKDFTFGQGVNWALWISKVIVLILFFLHVFIYLYFSFLFIFCLPNANEDISKEG
jgi:hypothetical protein